MVLAWLSSVCVCVRVSPCYQDTSQVGLRPIHRAFWGFPAGSEVNNPPAMLETWVWSLGWEDPLEKEIATCSSVLTWEIPWTEEPGRHGIAKESHTTEQLNKNKYDLFNDLFKTLSPNAVAFWGAGSQDSTCEFGGNGIQLLAGDD